MYKRQIFVAAVGISYELPFMSAGEKIKLRYTEADGVCTVSAITEPGTDFAAAEPVPAADPQAEEQAPVEGGEQAPEQA